MNLFRNKSYNKELYKYNVVIQDDARRNNTKDYKLADDIVKVKYLQVPKDFKEHKAKPYKIDKAMDFYNSHGYFDSPVTVIAETNEKGVPNTLRIVNGITRYVAARRLQVEYIPVIYISYEEYFIQKEYETKMWLSRLVKPIVRELNEYDDLDGNRGEKVTYIECPTCGSELDGESDMCECGQLLEV